MINTKLREAHVHRHPVNFKEHLVALSDTFFAYALKLNIQPEKSFFMTKVYHFIQDVKRKTTAIYQRGAKPIITKEYKGRFFNNYHIKVTQRKRYECYK